MVDIARVNLFGQLLEFFNPYKDFNNHENIS